MNSWLQQTKSRIIKLQQEGFYKKWRKIKRGSINFYLYPELNVEKEWFTKRIKVYQKNATLLRVKKPQANFYVYPSIEIGNKLGITPAISFIQSKEIHGHVKQSPGHELTHILLGKINSSKNLPGNGLWQEGLCTYLNGTKTNQKKHTLSLNFSPDTINTPWINWSKNLPGNIYPLAGSIIQYLVKRYGWKKLILFLKQMKNNSNNQNSLSKKLFGIYIAKIQNNWKLWLKKGD
jgi:hypothetical protein